MGIIDKIEEKLSGHSKTDKTDNDHLSQTTSSNTTANQYGSTTGTTHDPQSTLSSGTGVAGTGHHHHHHTGQGSHVPGTTTSSGLTSIGQQSSTGPVVPDRNTSSGQVLGGQGQHIGSQAAPGQSLTGQQTTSQLPGQSVGGQYTSGQSTGQHGQHGLAQTAGAGLAQHEIGRHEHGTTTQSFDPATSTHSSHHTGGHHHGHSHGGVTQAAEAGVAGGAIQHEVRKHEHGQHSGSIAQDGLQSQSGAIHQQPGSGIHESTRSHVPGYVSGHDSTRDTTIGQDSRSLGQSTSQTGAGSTSSAAGAAVGAAAGAATGHHHHHGHHGQHGQHEQQRGTVGLIPNAENPSAIPTAGGQPIGAGTAGETSLGSSSSTTTAGHSTGLGRDTTSHANTSGGVTGTGAGTGTGTTTGTTTGGAGGLTHDKLGEAYAAGYHHGSTNV